MKKIGKITLDGYCNYGNVLQSYALEPVLLQYGQVVETIWHTPSCTLANSCVPWTWKDFIKVITNYKGFRTSLLNGSYGWEAIRQSNIKVFCDQYINIQYHLSLEEVNDRYDYVVVGSDQVWNSAFENLDVSLLSFIAKEKRIAYAASFGVSEISNYEKNIFSSKLLEMKAISVREVAGANIIKKLIGIDVPVLIDPTLLLPVEAWERIEKEPVWYTKKNPGDYILTYFLGQMPKAIRTFVDRYKMKVINLLDKHIFDYYITAPQEFIYLIHHASLVMTDSFHGMVFSILFHRPFVVIDRMDNGLCSMNSRILSLLNILGLQNRRGLKANNFEVDNLFEPRYENVEDILERERRYSHEFLLNALNKNGMA